MGSITIAGTWRIDAPIDAVWDVVADLRTWQVWWPAIREVEPVDDDVARFTFDTPPPLRPLTMELEVVERSAPHRLRATSSDGPIHGDARIHVTDDPGHTAVTFDVGLRIRSLVLRPLEKVLAGATRSGGRERLRKAGDELAQLTGGIPLEHDL